MPLARNVRTVEAGSDSEQARAQFVTIASRLEQTYPDTNAHAGIGMTIGLGRDADVQKDMRRFAYLPLPPSASCCSWRARTWRGCCLRVPQAVNEIARGSPGAGRFAWFVNC